MVDMHVTLSDMQSGLNIIILTLPFTEVKAVQVKKKKSVKERIAEKEEKRRKELEEKRKQV